MTLLPQNEIRNYPCPHCHAEPGQPCRSPRADKVKHSHIDRQTLLVRELRRQDDIRPWPDDLTPPLRAYPCPHCHAQPGQPCRTPSQAKMQQGHRERQKLRDEPWRQCSDVNEDT